ncbi:MAG: AAA family ATPase [Actinomycetota bacterium]|jgi:DNA repair protein RadA/Sms
MSKHPAFACEACGRHAPQWSGRCADCGAWGQIREREPEPKRPRAASHSAVPLLDPSATEPARLSTGLPDLDRVLGGGLVPGSVVLLAGPPGIGKSTLLLQWLAAMAAAGRPGLVASGEESRAQVAARARRIGIAADAVSFAPGRDLHGVLAAARAERPAVLAVDSIQTLRDPEATTQPGGVSQVRGCVDALVELAKTDDTTVVVSGHVTKEGDLAGPRALEHAVDVVLAFEGDPRSGLRIVSGGKNRFGAEGETAWFEMGPAGLSPIDPAELLCSGERHPGAAVALPLAGRRALAVEIQALVGADDGPSRRQVTGLDLRRFQQVAAVLERSIGLPLGRSELFGAVGGGIKVDDPAGDLAVAAALASAATGEAPPEGAAFVGEIALTGQVRPAAAMEQRVAAARGAGCSTVFAPERAGPLDGLRVVTVGHLSEALGWALPPAGTVRRRRAS